MTDGEALLAAIVAHPADDLAWLALADWLEEDGQGPRAELLRLSRRLRELDRLSPYRPGVERRMCDLLEAGVKPCVPEMVNSVGMRFVLIPPGTFWMGSPGDEPGREEDEQLHEVTIERPFWIGKFPVIQGEFERVTGESPSYHNEKRRPWRFQGGHTSTLPVEQITVEHIERFLRSLREQSAERANVYRLPTEEEWEYACRAGTTTPYHFGCELTPSLACYDCSPSGLPALWETRSVGCYPANAFGPHDMHGNVYEMCAGPNWYLRGGSFQTPAEFLRSAARLDSATCAALPESADGPDPDYSADGNDQGFRVVLEWRGV